MVRQKILGAPRTSAEPFCGMLYLLLAATFPKLHGFSECRVAAPIGCLGVSSLRMLPALTKIDVALSTIWPANLGTPP